MSKKLRSYRLDNSTLETIEYLSKELNCNSTEVIRKALLLQKTVADNQDRGGSLLVNGKETLIL